MASDLSRLIFEKQKHYSAVRMQQGRVLLDSDWNAQSDIDQHRLHQQTIDVIGKSGVPVSSNGFELSRDDSGLSISAGRIYINGLLCELNEEIILNNDGEAVLISDNESGLAYALANPLPNQGTYLAYLEAWQRELTYLDDPQIREKALGNPDTTSRLQTVWQLKFAEVEENSDCQDVDLADFERQATGRMAARTVASEVSEDPCSFNQTSGYQRLENQLYRIEIVRGGSRANARFIWSRENASVQVNVIEINGSNTVRVHSLGRDDVLGFAIGNWVEFVNHESSLSREKNQLLQITAINTATNEVTVDGVIDQLDLRGLKMVRWDQESEALPLSTTYIDVEGGIQIRFRTGHYRAGDYWLIPARTIDSSIEWDISQFKPPKGVNNYFAKIGIVEFNNAQIQSIVDCRPLFPPLTDLPSIGGGCSTYHVQPVPGWEWVFNRIEQGENAKICFGVGTYTLRNTINIQQKGHLVLVGCGRGTIIQARGLQVAFRFEDCQSAQITDMSIRTTSVKNQNRDDVVSLKGGLTFVNVPEARVERTHHSTGYDSNPQATCITYYCDERNAGKVYISDCKLEIGFYQQGILIVNADRAIVQNNVLSSHPKPRDLSIRNRFRTSTRTRNAVMSNLMNNFSAEPNSNTNETVSFERVSVSFRTNPDIRNANYWQNFLNENPPETRVRSANDLGNYLQRTTALMLMNETSRATVLERFMANLDEEDPSIGFQGITIGGSVANDIHICRNRIEHFLQGIHVGLSHRHQSGEEHDFISSVKIESNLIINILTLVQTHGRHGIFVGNCERVSIDDNDLLLHRLSRAGRVPIDAIRIWGILGKKGRVSNNSITSATTAENSYNVGIHIENVEERDRLYHWNITWNTIESRNRGIDIPNNFLKSYIDTNDM